jgi:hypothetical protein
MLGYASDFDIGRAARRHGRVMDQLEYIYTALSLFFFFSLNSNVNTPDIRTHTHTHREREYIQGRKEGKIPKKKKERTKKLKKLREKNNKEMGEQKRTTCVFNIFRRGKIEKKEKEPHYAHFSLDNKIR